VAPTMEWKKWLWTTHHTKIGILYIAASLLFFFVGGAMAMVMRLELMFPGVQFLEPQFYNEMFTTHGTVMIFLVAMPLAAGFANYMIPIQVGAPDMAFPRLNALSFWLIPPAGLMLILGRPKVGWTGYAPLTSEAFTPGLSTNLWAIGLFVLGIASTLGAFNFLVTIIKMRRPGMDFMKLPLFSWSWLVTAILLILALPALGAALAMLFLDRNVGTTFFNPAVGGNPMMWQHLFWFFGHPEVYILILPTFGIVSEVIPKFSRKPLFGYKSMVLAIGSIAVLGFGVWAHHMFTTGMNPALRLGFMAFTIAIAVPTAVKIFNWIATMWGGQLQFKTPMLFASAFIFTFMLGGVSGVFNAVVPLDYQLHDTYWVVAHLHYVLFGGTLMGLFAGIYYWFPLMSGRMYDETLGKAHFWLTFIAMNLAFFPQHFLGTQGMRRRIVDYAPQFAEMNLLSTIGAFILGPAQLIMMYNLVHSARHGREAPQDPWGGPVPGPEWRPDILYDPVTGEKQDAPEYDKSDMTLGH
jgi:cytochrome c oxidase subunit 1